MRGLITFAVLTLIVAACGTEGGTATTDSEPTTTVTPETTTSTAGATTSAPAEETTTTTPPVSGARFVLTSISLGDGGMVVITNIGDEAGSLAGHFLCQRPSYFAIPDVEVPAGGFVAISTGGNAFVPPPGAITIDEIAAIGTLKPVDGEVGLYTSALFGSATDIVSYVEWGSSGHGRSSVAVEAGIWSGFVQTTADSVAILANTLPASDAAHWDVG
jgi:hypothetical protein